MQLEEAQSTMTGSSDFSTYEHHFLPLNNTGRVNPQIDYIIRDAKKRMAMAKNKLAAQKTRLLRSRV